MILGIDATNLRDGGGVTHLVELLKAVNPGEYGFSKVIVWSGSKTLNKIEERDWLDKQFLPVFDKNLPQRMFWQRFKLSKLARQTECKLLFAPGGAYAGNFHPVVTMSRNLLPFEWKELLRYGLSVKMLKMIFLRITQSFSFRLADGLIFLTSYAKEAVNKVTSIPNNKTTTIPHGISNRFLTKPRTPVAIENYNLKNPFKIIYVSVIEMYKHQWNVAEAVVRLRGEGLPIVLNLIGPAYPPALKKLNAKLAEIDPERNVVNYCGPVSHTELHANYLQSDLCVFASSCENMPNILLEGMASGLPIACSNMGPMPEVLEKGGMYFNPLDVTDIMNAIRQLVTSTALREEIANNAFKKVQIFSWENCAHDTFRFLSGIATRK